MFKCNSCSRSFKTRQALGGHVSRAHPQGGVSAANSPLERGVKEEEAVQPVMIVTAVPTLSVGEASEASAVPAEANREAGEIPASKVEEEEASQSGQILHYLKKGYTLRQLTDKSRFDFKDTTVRQEMAKLIVPDGEKMAEEATTNNDIPMIRRAGSGIEVLNPEAMLRRYTDGSVEDEIELRGMMKLRAAMLMVMDLVNIQKGEAEADSKRFAPMLEMLKESRIELDAAAARARDSSTEIAHAAAFEVAQGMQGAFSSEMQALKAALPGKPDEMNPLAKMFFGAMQPYAQQAIGQLFSGIFRMSPQAGAQPQGGQQPMAMPGQPTQQTAPDVPPSCMKPGEENEFSEA